VSGVVTVTGFEKICEILSPSAKDVLSLLSKTTFWSLMVLAVLDIFAAKMPDSLPEHFICLPVNGIQFMSENGIQFMSNKWNPVYAKNRHIKKNLFQHSMIVPSALTRDGQISPHG